MTAFTIPSHWNVKPFGGTLETMQTDPEYRAEMIRLYEKANEIWNDLVGRVKKKKLPPFYLEAASLMLAREAILPEKCLSGYREMVLKECAKIRKRLKI